MQYAATVRSSTLSECHLISLFKLLAFPFNIMLIVGAIVNSSTMFYHCDLLCKKLRVII